MKKYKVLIDLYKQSEAKNYKVGDEIELTEEEAKPLIENGTIEKEKRNPKS